MASDPVILSLDTTAAHCAAALLSGDRVLAHSFEPMAKGQAERLMVLVQDMLADCNLTPADLAAVAVCTGPGNFTGIRISVAAARGLALSLDIPAIGVSRLEALAHGQTGAVAALLDGRQGNVFMQIFADGTATSDPELVDGEDLEARLDEKTAVVLLGEAEPAAAAKIVTVAPAQIVLNVARIAAGQTGQDTPLPAPLYIRAPNAALPSDPPPRILP